MTELLVNTIDRQPRCGIITVRGYPHIGWGRDERPPAFRIIRVLDRTEAQLGFLRRRTGLAVKARFFLDLAVIRAEVKRAILGSRLCRVKWQDIGHAIGDVTRAIESEKSQAWARAARV